MKNTLLLTLLTSLSLTAATFNVSTTPELRTVLSTAATNGEDDTIVLADGTYKTTDDGGGTFIYLSNEANVLTLLGSSSDNVILSGDNQHQIFNHTSTINAPLKLEKLSFVDGRNSAGSAPACSGGGVYTDYSIEVTDCNFTNNRANNIYSSFGGGFSARSTIVKNSVFSNNYAAFGGGFYGNTPIITKSTFINNSTRFDGGGFKASSLATVTNSVFLNNQIGYGPGGAYSANSTNASGLLLVNNEEGIGLSSGNSIIINSIFIDNTIDIVGSSAIISNLENNYIDLSKLTISSFKSDNIYEGINLGFLDEVNGDYRLTASSDLLDVGVITIAGLTLPTTDLNGNARIVGASIDIGPYEFSSTKPTINSFAYTGTVKTYNELTFTVTATPSENRTISSTTYDYTNEGVYVNSNTYAFNTAGTHTVNVKITDSEGEHSIQSLNVTVEALAFDEMNLEQQLSSLITDTSKLNTILTKINDGETISLPLTSSDISSLPSGWSNIGIPTEVTDLSIFSSCTIIWIYRNDISTWQGYSADETIMASITESYATITSIPAGNGVWVKK